MVGVIVAGRDRAGVQGVPLSHGGSPEKLGWWSADVGYCCAPSNLRGLDCYEKGNNPYDDCK